MAWEVQQNTLFGGWVNTWTETTDSPDGMIEQPCVYSTEQEAKEALQEFLDDVQAEIDAGDRAPDEGFSEEEFRVAEVK